MSKNGFSIEIWDPSSSVLRLWRCLDKEKTWTVSEYSINNFVTYCTQQESDTEVCFICLCIKLLKIWGLVFGAGAESEWSGDRVLLCLYFGFCWRVPSSSSGAGSSCSCKAPVFRQPTKGVWKLSITRLSSHPHPWESFPVSLLVACLPLIYLHIHPAVHLSGILLSFLLYILGSSFIPLGT